MEIGDLMKAYEEYFINFNSFDNVLENEKRKAKEGLLSLDSADKFGILYPLVPRAEILTLKSIICLYSDEELLAVRFLTEAIKLHPLPLYQAWELSRLHYKRGDFIESIFYANMLEDMERIRSEKSFTDAAKSIKIMALCKLGFSNMASINYIDIKEPYFRLEGKPVSRAEIEEMVRGARQSPI